MLTYLTAGESHGPQLTAVIEGLPAGLNIDVEAVDYQLSRRQKGYGRGGRMKIEKDRVQFVGGLRGGVTMGGPISMIIANKDWENWTRIMHPIDPVPDDLNVREESLARDTHRPRPGHADLPGAIKWHHHDMRNVLERSSARETAARVALGAMARQLLEYFNVRFASHVVRIGDVALPDEFERPGIKEVIAKSEESEVRCLDAETEERMIQEIKAAKKDRDSVGGNSRLFAAPITSGLSTN